MVLARRCWRVEWRKPVGKSSPILSGQPEAVRGVATKPPGPSASGYKLVWTLRYYRIRGAVDDDAHCLAAYQMQMLVPSSRGDGREEGF
jgi:hypothetical protein